jgi:hypothetical protein
MISAEIPSSEIEKLAQVINIIERDLGKSSASILRQSMIFAVQSAAKATEPGRAGTPSKLPDKYKYRPITKYQPETPLYINDDTGFTFESAKRPKGRNIRKITRAWEFWNKAKGKMDHKPYKGTGKAKYDKENRFSKIPHAGAAKAGWLKALNRLPKAPGYSDTGASTGKAQPIVQEIHSGEMHQILVENIVRYIGKTSPNAANIGLANATNRMIGSYKKKIAELEKYKV